jgi:rhodanese-related sulfurtransferase
MTTQQTASRWIDVREYPEYAAGYIEGSELVPLSTLSSVAAAWDRSQSLVLICRSGRRAMQAQQTLAELGFRELSVLDGGVELWREQGKPLASISRRPWSLERQVRIAAGSLVLLTLALSLIASRYFLFATAFVGAGLVFAGVSDICMMATVLGRMPWNRGRSYRP